MTNLTIQVKVIVMITRLVEDKKIKAHQYWPDKEGEKSILTPCQIFFRQGDGFGA